MPEKNVCYYENSDEPTCPKCGGYNAMLHDSDGRRAAKERGESGDLDYRKCRDCGTTAVRIDK